MTAVRTSPVAAVKARLRSSEWDPGMVVVSVAAAVFAGVFIFLALRRYDAFSTARYDLGNMVQAIWSTAHGHLLEVTDSAGQQISRLGSHVDPILVAFVPLWWVFPTPKLLLVAQPLIVASGAFAAYGIARRWIGDWRVSAACAVVYLLYTPMQWSVVFDFHPVTLATPLLLWCVWAVEADRPVLVGVFAALSVLTKEEVGLAVAALGLWVLIRHGRTRMAAALIIGGLMWSFIAIAIIIPYFSPAGGSPFIARYGASGQTTSQVVESMLRHPLHEARLLVTSGRRHYLWDMLAPLLFLPLLAPLILIATVPELLLNMLSNDATQYSIFYQYTAVITPFLIVAMIGGIARARRLSDSWGGGLARRNSVMIGALAAAALVSGFLNGPIPIGKWIPGGSIRAAGQYTVSAHDQALAHAVSLIPPGVPVSATNPAGGRLSDRLHVYAWPVVGDAQWVLVDVGIPWLLDRRVKPWVNIALRGSPRANRPVRAGLARGRRRPVPAQFHEIVRSNCFERGDAATETTQKCPVCVTGHSSRPAAHRGPMRRLRFAESRAHLRISTAGLGLTGVAAAHAPGRDVSSASVFAMDATAELPNCLKVFLQATAAVGYSRGVDCGRPFAMTCP